jgi:hypothetical protein
VRVACCVRVGECGIEHLGERSTIDLARAVERHLVLPDVDAWSHRRGRRRSGIRTTGAAIIDAGCRDDAEQETLF